jgi:ribosomal-protein-alanine N-acetyltransferase
MISLQEVTPENFHRFKDPILEVEKSSFLSPWTIRTFEAETKRPVSQLWALLAGGKIGGYICFWIFANEAHLMNIAVHPQRRKRGFGGCLLKKLIEVSLSEGATKAWLEVRPSNVGARAFYIKAGFTEISRRPRYYRETNEDAIIMSLSLAPEDTGLMKSSYIWNVEHAA